MKYEKCLKCGLHSVSLETHVCSVLLARLPKKRKKESVIMKKNAPYKYRSVVVKEDFTQLSFSDKIILESSDEGNDPYNLVYIHKGKTKKMARNVNHLRICTLTDKEFVFIIDSDAIHIKKISMMDGKDSGISFNIVSSNIIKIR
jgi:hypothetical protein